ncbi:type II CAAX endopeptidase family protein [Microbacterium sp. CCNWLW134]|uniref:CPBP family intramembrane glutamic endopeptidase n=1 Tax=Microbacterium sp. CCNWLW134 TaxID=3122064 RepID=UPI00300FDB68
MPTATTTPGPRVGTGWRVTVVLAGTIVIWGLMVWLSTAVWGDEVGPARRISSALFVLALTVPMIVVVRRFLDRRPWSTLRLEMGPSLWRPLLIGVGSFVVPSAIGLGVANAAGWVRITTDLPPATLVGAVAFTVLTVLLLEAIPEEVIFRGYVYRTLSASVAPVRAVLIQAVLFALLGTTLWVTTTGWGVIAERGSLFLVMGVVLGIQRLVSDSVWTPIGFHLGFQVVAQSLLTNPAVQTSSALVVTVAGIVPGFVFSVAITRFFIRRKTNWTLPEPDASL